MNTGTWYRLTDGHGHFWEIPPARAEFQDEQQVIKRWVIVQRVGEIPETKRPLKETDEGAETLLRELVAIEHESTVLMLAQLAYGNDLWVSNGRAHLHELDIMRGLVKVDED